MNENVFLKAFWETPSSALVFLSQDWASESTQLPLFLNPNDIRFEIERARDYDNARMSGYYISKDTIRFVFDPSTHATLDLDSRIYVTGEFNGWEKAVGHEKYLLFPFEMDGYPVFVVDVPVSELKGDHISNFRFVTDKFRWLSVAENAPNLVPNRYQGSDYMLNLKQGGRHVFRIRTIDEVSLQSHVELEWRDAMNQDKISISNSEFYLSLSSDKTMGVTREGDRFIFRLFAPRASRVVLELFKSFGKTTHSLYPLTMDEDGTWEVSLPANFDRYYYYYYIDGNNYDASTSFDFSLPVVDPYAKAMASSKGPGIVIDPERFPPVKGHFHPPLWHDLVISEVHIRDLIAKSRMPLGKTERTQYSGMAKWLRNKQNYLRSLGVNALEFQPLHEFEYESKEEYHWGYMPVNYFSPASAHAKYPKSGQQMEGFKDMVSACHEAGFAFILDVVYNHIGTPNALFAIDKHYYLELDSNFNLTNWSGVGNDLRCQSPMTRRLIIDSLKYYVTHYDVDGFRFDLAELIGRSVLAEIEKELKAIKPSIILIAEPWSFRGHIADKLKSTGFSSWNDRYREFFVSYLKGNGSLYEFEYLFRGSPGGLTRFPAQTVNYSESHDDYCWLDQITENPHRDGTHPSFNDVRRTHLMFSMLFMSLGIPMIAEGQDFLRSKHGIRNTYQHGDVNALDYDRMSSFSNSHEYVRNWIRFRLSPLGYLLRLEFQPEDDYFKFYRCRDDGRAVCVVINDNNQHGSQQLIYVINPEAVKRWIDVPESLFKNTRQIADQNRVDPNGLTTAFIQQEKGIVYLPPMTCGLWIRS
jgi:pullulanase